MPVLPGVAGLPRGHGRLWLGSAQFFRRFAGELRCFWIWIVVGEMWYLFVLKQGGDPNGKTKAVRRRHGAQAR